MNENEHELEPAHPSGPERLFGRIAIVALYAMAILVAVNVATRFLGGAIIPDDVVIVRELMVFVILLPVGIVTALREHISVDVLTNWATRRGQLVLAVLQHLIGLLFIGLVAYAAWQSATDAWRINEYTPGELNVPTFIGHFAFFFGIAIFLLRLGAMLVRDLQRLFETS